MDTTKTIDTYIQEFPENVQKILVSLRTNIAKDAPEAVETMSYGMPTFKLHDKNMIHFAAYKDHIGIYPTSSNLEKYLPEVAEYRTGKGTLRFSLEKELPMELIKKIVKIRIQEIQNGISNY